MHEYTAFHSPLQAHLILILATGQGLLVWAQEDARRYAGCISERSLRCRIWQLSALIKLAPSAGQAAFIDGGDLGLALQSSRNLKALRHTTSYSRMTGHYDCLSDAGHAGEMRRTGV